MVCGLVKSLSVITIVPFLVPMAVGVNVTLIAHCVPGGKALAQVLVVEKSPVEVMVPMASAELALLASVTAMDLAGLAVPTAWVANFTLGGEKVTEVPVPPRLIICGLAGSLVTR